MMGFFPAFDIAAAIREEVSLGLTHFYENGNRFFPAAFSSSFSATNFWRARGNRRWREGGGEKRPICNAAETNRGEATGVSNQAAHHQTRNVSGQAAVVIFESAYR